MGNLDKIVIIVFVFVIAVAGFAMLRDIRTTVKDIHKIMKLEETQKTKVHECWNNPSGNILDCILLETLKGEK